MDKGTIRLKENATYDMTGSYPSLVKDKSTGDPWIIDYRQVFKGIGKGHTHTISETNFTAVTTNGRQFTASFDGRGATVKVALDNTYTTSQNGFFGYVVQLGGQIPVIENLIVTGSVKGKSFTGGLVGYTNKNGYQFRNITISNLVIEGETAGGIIGGIGYGGSNLIRPVGSTEPVPNFDRLTILGSSSIKASGTAGGLAGLVSSTSLAVEESAVQAGATIEGGSGAGGAIGQVVFHTYAEQTDYWQIRHSSFQGLTIQSSAGSAGGVLGLHTIGDSKMSQIHLVELNVQGNTVTGSSPSRTGTVLGYSNAVNPSTHTFGIYGINVYDEHTILKVGTNVQSYRDAGTCQADFNLIRHTDFNQLVSAGITAPATPASRGDLLPGILDHQDNSNFIWDTENPDRLKYLLYDSAQSAELDLNEFFTQINQAITSTGVISQKVVNDQTVRIVENTFDHVNWYSYTSAGFTDGGATGGTGNLTWRRSAGSDIFKIRRSDPSGQWTMMTVTYNLFDKRRANTASNRPLTVQMQIPVKVDVQIGIATRSWLKEGDALSEAGEIANVSDATFRNYKYHQASTPVSDGYGPLELNNDGRYTAYIEFAYSGDRFLVDTVNYDADDNPIINYPAGVTAATWEQWLTDNPDQNPEDYYSRHQLTIDKMFELSAPGGSLVLPKGTQLTLVDLDNHQTYVHSVTAEAGVDKVLFSQFKTMQQDIAYVEKDVSNKVALPEISQIPGAGYASYLFHKGAKVINDSRAGLERFLLLINLAETSWENVASIATVKSQVWMLPNTDGANGLTKDLFGIDTWYNDVQSYTSIGPRRDISLEFKGPVESFSQSIPLKVNLLLKDAIKAGYSFDTDLVNREKPYLEIAFAITRDPAGNQVQELSQGIQIYYGNETTPLTKTNTGQILFMKDQGKNYDMRTYNLGETLATTTDVSLQIDFADALDYNFSSSNPYWLKASIYRTADPDFPLGGNPVDTLMIPIRVESDKDYGYRLDVAQQDLVINLRDRVEDPAGSDPRIRDLPFAAQFSNVQDNNINTMVEYTLYHKNDNGQYIRCDENWPDSLPGASLDGLSLAIQYNGSYQIQKAFNDGKIVHPLWYYNLEGQSDPKRAQYTFADQTVAVGDVTVSISKNRITQITVQDGATDLTATYSSLINEIIAQNGIGGLAQSMTLDQRAVYETILEILASARTSSTTDGAGSLAMKLTGLSDSLPVGNYKLVGTLITNQVEVATDFFIFNVNQNVLLDPIQ